MTVAAALEALREVGTVCVSRGNLKLRFPQEKRAQLGPAIAILRSRKAEAMALLNAEQSSQVAIDSHRLKNQAIELWRSGERYFIVADEADVDLAISRLKASIGETWTTHEIEIIAKIEDPAFRDEVQRYKRQFSGRIRQGGRAR